MANKINKIVVEDNTKLLGCFTATVHTKKGEILRTNYRDEPTISEVEEDFTNPKTRKNFK